MLILPDCLILRSVYLKIKLLVVSFTGVPTGYTYGPKHGRRLELFIDDLHLPLRHSSAACTAHEVHVMRTLSPTCLHPPSPTFTHPPSPSFTTFTHLHPPSPTFTHLHPPSPTFTHLHPPSPTFTHLHPPTFTLFHPPSPTFTHLHPPSPTFTHLHPPSPTFTHLHPPSLSSPPLNNCTCCTQ